MTRPIALIITLISIILSLAIWSRLTPPKVVLPEFEETSKLVVVRVYANVAVPGDSYLLVSADGFVCYVDQDTWLQSVLGTSTECVWRKI